MPNPKQEKLDAPLVRLILVMALGTLMASFDTTIVNVGIHTLAALHAGLSTIEWVSTGYLLTLSMATPVSGWAVDKFGGKTIWLTFVTGFVVTSLLSASAWSVGALIAFRLLQGFCGGMLLPTMMTLLARAAGPGRQGAAFGLAAVPVTLGPILGPIIGGLILDHLSWRWLFLINPPIGVVALVLAVAFMPSLKRGPGEPPRQLDGVGLLLLSPAFAALVYALSQAASAGFGAGRVIVSLVIGAVLLAGYIGHAFTTSATPLVELRLFSRRGFATSVSMMSMSGATVFGTLFLIPLYYQVVKGDSPLHAGLLLVALGVGGVFGMPVAGKLSDQLGTRALVPVGGLLIALAMLGYATASLTTSQILLVVCLFVAGIGISLIDAPTMSSVYRTVPPAAADSATTTLFVVNQIFGSLAVAVVALQLLHNAGHVSVLTAYRGAFWWIFGAAVVVLVAGFGMPGRAAKATGAPAAETVEQASIDAEH